MSAVTLGSSELKVSKIILGCALYGSPDCLGRVQDEEESIKQIKTAFDAGINTFDTSNMYSNEQSEVILGKAIRQENLPRDRIAVMTKVFHPVSLDVDGCVDGEAAEHAGSHGYANQYSLAREDIFYSIKKSLERLQLDYIDVLHCHEYDASTPTHETMQALHDAVKAGWVRYVGMSNCRAWQFYVMQSHAVNNALTPFISMQNDYNLLYHQDEHEMLPTLKFLDVSFLPLSSLVNGAMSMPLDQQLALPADNMVPGGRQEWHNTIITRLEEIALQKNITMTEVAVAWSMRHERQYPETPYSSLSNPVGVGALILSGPTTRQLLDAIRGVDVLLTPADVEYLEEPYVPQKLRH
ncbi:NADP-dependent oxidoreductase domain-containing protein [Armillaria novae-zelandiae]|uniref:NADP-dependent oxidoreductase domain-containing protein n=1 Tax=Armillaria novae-zelandiae TaxID=153914 RepID=A0AA39U5L5_9AGAR|nr:NADP-dependent oxidoreductase domain-containing protein [Armillaria novae-zelandiae]